MPKANPRERQADGSRTKELRDAIDDFIREELEDVDKTMEYFHRKVERLDRLRRALQGRSSPARQT